MISMNLCQNKSMQYILMKKVFTRYTFGYLNVTSRIALVDITCVKMQNSFHDFVKM